MSSFTTIAAVETRGLAEPGRDRLSLGFHKSPVPRELQVEYYEQLPANQSDNLDETTHS